ncbi:MAG: tail fiber domain-containing protein, partial [Bacteroidota bacterium]
ASTAHTAIAITNQDARAGIELESQNATANGEGIFNIGLNTNRGITELGTNPSSAWFRIDTRAAKRSFQWYWKDADSNIEDQLMVLDHEGNLGIGTNNPDAPLQVKTDNPTPEAVIARFTTETDRHLQLLQPDNSNGNNPFTFYTNNAFNFRVDAKDALTIDDGGKIGIGNHNPTEKLHIKGGNIRMDGGEIQHWGILDFQPDVDKSGDDIIRFLNSTGNENIRIHSNGYLGIGTTTPDASLHIDGSFRLENGSQQDGYVLSSDANGTAIWKDPNSLISVNNPSGAFAVSNNLVLPDSNQIDLATDDFIFGSTHLDGDYNPDYHHRFFFDKSRGAFRAGMAENYASSGPISFLSNYWNDINIGDYSVAFGKNNLAGGDYASAWGELTNASGNHATAFGYSTIAPAYLETALGQHNTDYTPYGTDTWDDRDRLLVIGNGTASTPSNALSIYKDGTMNINDAYNLPTTDGTTGQVLTTNGAGETNWTTSSSSGGAGILSVSNNTVIPDSNQIDLATDDFVFGSTHLDGNGNTAYNHRFFFDKSRGAFRAGMAEDFNIVDPITSNQVTLNFWDDPIVGDYSLAFGKNNFAIGDYSAAWGESTNASGSHATAFGYGTIAFAYLETAFGRYNTKPLTYGINSWDDRDRLLVIGNGTASTPSNALSIYKDGTMNINDAYDLPTTDGTVGQVLTTNGAGETNWTTPEEGQTLSLTGNDLSISDGNTVDLSTLVPSVNSSFEVVANVVLPNTSVVDETSHDFVFGSTQLDDDGNPDHDHRFFFDKSKGAFRAGAVDHGIWDESNMGDYSIAMGFYTGASGNYSTALGSWSSASGSYSTAMGAGVNASSFRETVLGSHNTTYSANSTTSWNTSDRLFTIGNGTSFIDRSDALIVYKNGDMDLNGKLSMNENIKINDHWISNDGDDEGLYVNSAGNVGIGTNNPESKFTISSGGQIGGTNNGLKLTNDSNNDWYIYQNINKGITFNDDGVDRMTIASNGSVGIGTDATNGHLEVSGFELLSLTDYGKLNSNGNTSNPNSGTMNASIYAEHRIVGSQIVAHSDRRIKTNLSRTDNNEDLNTLMGIAITDYEFVDKVAKGDKQEKKVIAQELKKVYPQAVVDQLTQVVPDIMQYARAKEGWISLDNHKLKVGEFVRLVYDTGSAEFEVLDVKDHAFKVAFDQEEALLVYGRQVNDFHTVDYDAVAMLNVSATQAQQKLIEAQAAKIQALEAALATSKETLSNYKASTESRLAKLEALLQQKAPSTNPSLSSSK